MTADNTYFDNLDAAFAHAWQELAHAVADRRHGFRILQLATVACDTTPRLRSIVLRGVVIETAVLIWPRLRFITPMGV
ncbi:MAG: hypothetical protein WDZ86_07595 [Gammaproteobacteria bacterium]